MTSMTRTKKRTVLPALLLGPALLVPAACGDGGKGGSTGEAAGSGTFATVELEAEYTKPFSLLLSVRERDDGTVMAADPLSQVLLRVDLVAGTADTLGRVGGGPQEYEQPDQVFPLPADSTLLVDLGKGRLTVVDPQGTFHTGMKMAVASEEMPLLIIQPRFVDGEGRLYFESGFGSGDGPRDSLRVSRYDRTTGEAEVLGRTWRTPPIVTRIDGGMRMTQVQMAPRDDWAVGLDGSVAIVRADGYRVEWHRPDGQVITGPATELQMPSLSDEDKYAFLEAPHPAGMRISVFSGDNGAVDVSMSRTGGSSRGREEINLADYEWAERYPPFRPDRARISPSGELWVQRWLHPGDGPLFDVFDGTGVKQGSVRLPRGRRIVGWGTTADGDPAVYLVRADEFDLNWLERYRVVW